MAAHGERLDFFERILERSKHDFHTFRENKALSMFNAILVQYLVSISQFQIYLSWFPIYISIIWFLIFKKYFNLPFHIPFSLILVLSKCLTIWCSIWPQYILNSSWLSLVPNGIGSMFLQGDIHKFNIHNLHSQISLTFYCGTSRLARW